MVLFSRRSVISLQVGHLFIMNVSDMLLLALKKVIMTRIHDTDYHKLKKMTDLPAKVSQ